MTTSTIAALEPAAAVAADARVSLTAAAVQHVKQFARSKDKPCSVRVGVRTSSCSAYAYTFELNTKVAADDYICEYDGVKLIIDPKSLVFLDGMKIDFRREGIQEGFHFENPNIKGTCGCGESFTV